MSASNLLGFVPLLIGFITEPPNYLLFQYASKPEFGVLPIEDDGPTGVLPKSLESNSGL
jgi:hypothetical protein